MDGTNLALTDFVCLFWGYEDIVKLISGGLLESGSYVAGQVKGYGYSAPT
ncbi:hypothetical protein ACFLW1_03695 [Chloroflexota bacterium]